VNCMLKVQKKELDCQLKARKLKMANLNDVQRPAKGSSQILALK
jgi:hypothetical protein